MFIIVIEKRFSCEVKHKGDKKQAQDWYSLVACVLPFAPKIGTEIQAEPEPVYLNRVIYDPTDCVFYAETYDVVHPKLPAKEAAEQMVNKYKWDIALEETLLAEAKKKLASQASRKLKSTILRAHPFVASGALGVGRHKDR